MTPVKKTQKVIFFQWDRTQYYGKKTCSHQKADIEEGWHGHGQSEEQGSNPASSFDETKDSADFCDSDDSKQRWRDKVFLDEVTQNDAWNNKS